MEKARSHMCQDRTELRVTNTEKKEILSIIQYEDQGSKLLIVI